MRGLKTPIQMQTEHLELLFATPWTEALWAPLSMDFRGKNTGVDCSFSLQIVWSLSAKWVGARKQSPFMMKGKLVGAFAPDH